MSEYSKNDRAESVMGTRAPGIAFDLPCELGYQCPVCRMKWDEGLAWSEYNSFVWCSKCNFDYPSAMCVPLDTTPDPERPYVNAGREAMVRVFLDTVEDAKRRAPARSEEGEDSIAVGSKALRFIESQGYRRCDIPACNCGSWHGGNMRARFDEIHDLLVEHDVETNGKTLLGAVRGVLEDASSLRAELAALKQASAPTPTREAVTVEYMDAANSLRATAFVMFHAIRSNVPVAPDILDSIMPDIERMDTAREKMESSTPPVAPSEFVAAATELRIWTDNFLEGVRSSGLFVSGPGHSQALNEMLRAVEKFDTARKALDAGGAKP